MLSSSRQEDWRRIQETLRPLQDPDGLMLLTEEELSKIDFLRRRGRRLAFQGFLQGLEDGLRDIGVFAMWVCLLVWLVLHTLFFATRRAGACVHL